jgi:SAM-dependent methyltransferase
VDRLPDDPAARQDWLEHWAAEQQRRIDEGPVPITRQIRKALAAAPAQLEAASTQYVNRLLDRGLDTSGDSDEPEHAHSERVRYVPVAWHVLPRALHFVGVRRDDTFIDFGCGKGRAVHQAAMRPFRRVIGVEVSPPLAQIARAGLAARGHRHRCRDVQIVVCDAAEFPVPDDLTVAYFFDPFHGATLDTVLGHIVESIDRRPRRVSLIYVHPQHARQVLATGRFRLVKEQRGGLRDTRVNRAAIFESVPRG